MSCQLKISFSIAFIPKKGKLPIWQDLLILPLYNFAAVALRARDKFVQSCDCQGFKHRPAHFNLSGPFFSVLPELTSLPPTPLQTIIKHLTYNYIKQS